MEFRSKWMLRHRLVGIFLVLTMLLSVLPVANVEAAATYDYAKIANIAKSSDVESLFNNYINFIGKYINDVGDMETFMFAVKDPIAVLKSIVTGANSQESANRFMNDPEYVKPILRDAIGKITDNRDFKAFPDDGKVVAEAFEKYFKLYGKISGSDRYENKANFMEDLGKVFGTTENTIKIIKDYTENMIMLDSIKDLFPSGSASRKMIEKLESDYSHSLYSTTRDLVAKKIKKTTIRAIDPLGIYSIIQFGLKNNASVKALDYVIYSNTLQCEAIQAYKKAATIIKSGNYTNNDMIAYINAFELCRALMVKSYEKMVGKYGLNSDEYKYLTEQIANLKKMSCEKPIKAIIYSNWKADSGAEYPINVIAVSATTYYAVKDNVPVRARPYAADTILKNLKKGTAVTVVGTGINSAGNLWCKLNDGNWVFSDNLSITNPVSAGITSTTPTPATTTNKSSSASSAPSASKQLIADGVFKITTQLDNRYCLVVTDSKANSGLALNDSYAFPYAGFRVTHLGENYYRIECDYYNMVLTSNTSGTDAYVYPNGGTDAQIWKIQPVGNSSYQIINKQNGQFLDVANAYVANGTKVGLFVQNDAYDAQKWVFNTVSSTNLDPTPVATPKPTVTSTPASTTTPGFGLATIKYDANGGSGAPVSYTVNKDRDSNIYFNLSTTKPTMNGYVFLGWRLFNDLAYDIDSPGQRIAYSTGNTTSNDTLTYYAQWKAITSTPTVMFSNMSTGWDESGFLFQFSYRAEGNKVIDAYVTTQTDIGYKSSDDEGPWLQTDFLRIHCPNDWFTTGKAYSWAATVKIDGQEIISPVYSFTFKKL